MYAYKIKYTTHIYIKIIQLVYYIIFIINIYEYDKTKLLYT